MELNKKFEITHQDLLNGISFHGETNADNQSLEKLKELGSLLSQTMFHISVLEFELSHRNDYSAMKLSTQIKSIKRRLLQNIFSEEYWTDAMILINRDEIKKDYERYVD